MSEPIVIYQCPTCHRASDGEASDAHCAGAMYDGSAHDIAEMVRVPVIRQEDVRLTEDESNGLRSALNAAQHFGVLSDSRVGALRARVDAGFVDGPSWEEVRPLWEALGTLKLSSTHDMVLAAAAARDAFRAPEAWTTRDDETSPTEAWRCDNCESVFAGEDAPADCPNCDVGPIGSWTGADLSEAEDPEPSDYQIYNGHGMEGGIPYSDPRMLPLEDRPL